MLKNMKALMRSREMHFQIIDWFLLTTLVFYFKNRTWNLIIGLSLVIFIGCFFLINTLRRRKNISQYPADLPKKAQPTVTTLAIELSFFPEIGFWYLFPLLGHQPTPSLETVMLQLGGISGLTILTSLYLNVKLNNLKP
ncbi:hypothetical protein [Lactiplantibacillus mudanjiangensis]|uniref:Uncharacterized protein n=1 Tax=Lactiplantibacillus mudanjiangensis TaxID=1296538 RepID=A0A660E0S7_9LACO|nr:hypothetical protein [Lactiplantibacillus mudanjiangensis]VDG19393.1 hypothetical protein MUDAN_BIHEEGNE_01143 [Lactiplantibacillus mudanjiangensis]VDG24722.1 hypothetical protein MUDAN_IGPPGNFN_02909 [Lactiplantibacillus mudanjiangensis]VDG28024.1 hypothetical protein MUDAN_MDHGFNIF_02829 [Lactiplantibacillus mudanjiangensis]VDG30852.1 hypothetical protein MUDAN_DOGOELCO_00353 [Lactiplantibacillus mudanjiangensis]